jgi:peptide/nickel transport system ATP-binding protein
VLPETTGITEDLQPALEAVDLTKHFPIHSSVFGRGRGRKLALHAVDGVSLSLYPGHVTALVGESGSGKSTIARLLARLYPPSGGTIRLHGKPVKATRRRSLKGHAGDVQLILQDPFSSFNPVHTVGYHLGRPLRIHGFAKSRAEVDAGIEKLLAEVNLTPARQFSDKFPHELSGGQRQRISIARALAAQPSVILADEPVSMLDVSIRLGILNLLEKLATERRLALLYITHDIASARYFAETTLVLYAAEMIEGGPSEAVTQAPAHPYTQLLIASAPHPERRRTSADRPPALGQPPSLTSPPTGCRFQPRCPYAMEICRTTAPPRSDLGGGHWARCWLHSDSANESANGSAKRSLSAGRKEP